MNNKVKNVSHDLVLIIDGWMTCDFRSFSTAFQSVILEQWADDNERLCEIEVPLWLRRFCLKLGSNSGR